MEYYGIKIPQRSINKPSYIWFISNTPSISWRMFFSSQDKDGEYNAHTYTLAEAIKAYEGIGYRCVELNISVKTIMEPTVYYCNYKSIKDNLYKTSCNNEITINELEGFNYCPFCNNTIKIEGK